MSVRFEWNAAGFRDLMRSSEVLADLRRRGNAIAGAAGAGHDVQEFTGRKRARVTVRTSTRAAREREATTRNLTSALDAGR